MEKSKISVKQITYVGTFIAISVFVNSMRMGYFSFGGFPIILSGYCLGPVLGFIVGGLTDVVGFIVRPSKLPFNPAFALTSALTGAIPVMVSRVLGDKYPDYKFRNILAGIFVGQVITSVMMVPMFISIFFSKTTFMERFLLEVFRAAKKQITSIPLYAMLAKPVLDTITKAIDFENI